MTDAGLVCRTPGSAFDEPLIISVHAAQTINDNGQHDCSVVPGWMIADPNVIGAE